MVYIANLFLQIFVVYNLLNLYLKKRYIFQDISIYLKVFRRYREISRVLLYIENIELKKLLLNR